MSFHCDDTDVFIAIEVSTESPYNLKTCLSMSGWLPKIKKAWLSLMTFYVILIDPIYVLRTIACYGKKNGDSDDTSKQGGLEPKEGHSD